MLSQRFQVCLRPQLRAKLGQSSGSVVLAAVEGPINQRLDTATQWREQSRDEQGRPNDDERLLARLPDERLSHCLYAEHGREIDRYHDDGQYAVRNPR